MIYKKGNAICKVKIDETWQEIADEIVETPIGTQLKSYTLTPEYAERLERQQKINRIAELKSQIAKYKEDVEQVELFGMERADYEEKKAQCVSIIQQLRELEKEVS